MKKILKGIAYLPRENSNHSNGDSFNMTELKMQKLSFDDKHVIFTGDSNARTGTSSEYFNIEKGKKMTNLMKLSIEARYIACKYILCLKVRALFFFSFFFFGSHWL